MCIDCLCKRFINSLVHPLCDVCIGPSTLLFAPVGFLYRQQLPYAARTLSSLSCEIPLEGALPILALDYDPHTGCLQYSQDEVYTYAWCGCVCVRVPTCMLCMCCVCAVHVLCMRVWLGDDGFILYHAFFPLHESKNVSLFRICSAQLLVFFFGSCAIECS